MVCDQAIATSPSEDAPWRRPPEEPEADASDGEDWTSVATTEDRLFDSKKLFIVHAYAMDSTIALLPTTNRLFSDRNEVVALIA